MIYQFMICFAVPAANYVWVSDITYEATAEGWIYRSVIEDLYSRRVVGWSMETSLATYMVLLSAFMMAVWNRRPPRGLMFNSDYGVQYASHAFRKVLRRHGMLRTKESGSSFTWNALKMAFFRTIYWLCVVILPASLVT